MTNDVNETLDRILHEVVENRRALEGRIGGVEARVSSLGEKLDNFRAEALDHFDAIYGRLGLLESEYHAITAALARVEKMLAEQAADRKVLQEEIESLKSRIAELEKRLAEIEAELDDSHDA